MLKIQLTDSPPAFKSRIEDEINTFVILSLSIKFKKKYIEIESIIFNKYEDKKNKNEFD